MKNTVSNRDGLVSDFLLKASEKEYKALFDHSPIPMWIYDLETYEFLDVNNAAVCNYGYSRREFLQMTIKDIRPVDDVPLLEKAVNHIRVNHRPYGNQYYRHLKKNGEKIYVKIDGKVICHNDRIAEIVLAKDITSEIVSRNELKQTNSKLKTAQQIANMGYWTRNLGEETFDWSDEVFKIFEQDPAHFECTLSRLADTFHPEDRYLLHQDLEHTFPDSGHYDFEHRIVTGTGKVKWIFQRIRLIRDEKGQPVRIEGVVQDIDRRKRSEEALIRKKNLLKATNKFMALLMKHANWSTAVSRSFAVIGNTLNVDRVYYFENSTDPATGALTTSQKIEWTNDSTLPQIDSPVFQNIPLSNFAAYTDPLFRNQHFAAIISELPDGQLKQILEMQDIKSFLVIPVFVHGHFHSFIGFDDCSEERKWQQDEIDFLRTITSSLATVIEQKKSERAILESNERFKIVMRASLEAIIDWDIKNDTTVWGNGFQELFGYDLGQYDNHLWSRNIHAQDRERVLAELKQVMEDPGQEEFYTEFRFLRANGDIAYVQHRGIFIRDENGQPVRGIASMIDMTDTRKKTMEIEEQNRVLKEIAWTQSHIVRAPLTRIMGLVELFRCREAMELTHEELADKLMEAATELDGVIYDIVRKSERIQKETRRHTDIVATPPPDQGFTISSHD